MYESVTVKQFSDAWFFGKYDTLSKEDFDICYSEYIDATGLFSTAEFDLICYVNYLNNKVNVLKLSVSIHKQFVEEFGTPFEEAFFVFRKFGYRVTWKNSKDDFFDQLDKILKKHSKFEIELNSKKQQLEKEREKHKDDKEPDKKKSRVEFLKMLNVLAKIGYRIDKNETTVEEMALMVKQQLEEQEEHKLKANA